PAIKAILDSPDMRLDGFLGPGHVSTVIGCKPYEFIARDHAKPLVCAGFEPLDILASLYQLMVQLKEGRCEVETQSTRIKPWECKVFGTACTPETPIGTCMVSPEGACAAYYNFGRFTRERVKEATRT